MGGFASALSTSDAQSLLERFAPYVWLYSEEPFFPCSVDWYLARVQLGFAHQGTVGYNTSIISSTVTAANLNTTTNDGQSSGGALSGATVPADNFFVLPVTGGAGSGTYTGWRPSSSGANAYRSGQVPPVYGGVIDRHDSAGTTVVGYDLVYAFFYAYNGQAMFDPGIGVHEGDLEHVVVRVASDQQTLLAVYYRQHSSSDQYNGWYYPPGPDVPQAGSILFEAHTPQRCVVYSARCSHASYPRQADSWSYWKGTDEVDQGYAWDTAGNVVVMNDPSQNYWLDYLGRFGAAPPAQWINSFPPTSPITQNWQAVIASGPFIDREVYCQHLSGQTSRVSAGQFYIAQVGLSWAFDDPNGWLSSDQLNRITLSLSHDVSGQDQRAITGITNGVVTSPPYAHTDNVYFSNLQYTDASGKVHTGYDDAWKMMTAESIARGGSTVTFRVVCTWLAAQNAATPQTPAIAGPYREQSAHPVAAATGLGQSTGSEHESDGASASHL